jgi:hypothetical protein
VYQIQSANGCGSELTLWFWQIKFYHTSDNDRGGGFIPLALQLSKSLGWISELADEKPSRFSNLKDVALHEHAYFREEWCYPQDLLEAFETAGIRLFVTISSAM